MREAPSRFPLGSEVARSLMVHVVCLQGVEFHLAWGREMQTRCGDPRGDYLWRSIDVVGAVSRDCFPQTVLDVAGAPMRHCKLHSNSVVCGATTRNSGFSQVWMWLVLSGGIAAFSRLS